MTPLAKPTLVTITAPTCSGKTFLLEALLKQGFSRVISTTTRAPRAGEREGVDFYFISEERSIEIEKEDGFAELVNFRGTRYGVTKVVLAKKMQGVELPVVIVEPSGTRQYERYCKENNWEIFKIFVSTPEEARIWRLKQRTFHELVEVVNKGYTEENSLAVKNIIRTHTDRLLSITGEERTWKDAHTWDVVVDGEDICSALATIEQGMKWRNSQSAHLNT